MNLDQLFEDLETQFEAAISENQAKPKYRVGRLTTSVSGNKLSIDRPVFGDGYLAGLISGRAIWRFQPHRSLSVAKITFTADIESELETLSAAELLGESLSGRFVRYSLFGDGQQIRRGRVVSLMQGLILFESTAEVVAVAIERLAWLEVHAIDN